MTAGTIVKAVPALDNSRTGLRLNISMVTRERNWLDEITRAEGQIKDLGLRRGEAAAQTRREICRVLGGIPGGIDDARRARLLLDLAKQIFQIGEFLLLAVEPAAQAVLAARGSDEPLLLRECLTGQGVILTNVDNVHDAVVCFEEALTIVEAHPDQLDAKFSVLLNIGVALYQAFLHSDAIAAYQRAADVARASGNRRWQAMVLHNIALCSLETRQFDVGLAAIERAIALVGAGANRPDEMTERVFMEGVFVRLLLQFGRVGEAKERLVFAKSFAEQSGSVRAQIDAGGAEALCSIYEGMTDIGRERVLKTLELARAIPASTRSALLTAVQAFEAIGDRGEALAYHREFALMMKRQLRERVMQYSKHHMILLSETELSVVSEISDKRTEELRHQYARALGESKTAGWLLSQAITAEAEWDHEMVHVYRIGFLVAELARASGCDETLVEHLREAARLHDIGMKAVPRSLKLKVGSLLPEEANELKKHTLDGADLLAHSNLPHSSYAEDIARNHHERWDGRGYPDGLRGNGIPLGARMTSLADTFDTMLHDGRMRARTVAETLFEIESGLGKQFDPVLGERFVAMIKSVIARGDDIEQWMRSDVVDSSLARTREKLRPKS